MTDHDRITRLAAILGISPTVTFAKYRGGGERTFRRGWVTASMEATSTDAPDEASAIRALANGLEYIAEHATVGAERNVDWPRKQAAQKRKLAAQLRAEAEAADAEATRIDGEVEASLAKARGITEAFAAYQSEVNPAPAANVPDAGETR